MKTQKQSFLEKFASFADRLHEFVNIVIKLILLVGFLFLLYKCS